MTAREPSGTAGRLVPVSKGSRGGERAVAARAAFAEFLPDVEAVTERRHSPFASLLILLIAGFILSALAWAHFAEVEQVATAGGVVRPMGRIKTVNHPDGGRVTELLVEEGTAVEAGQVLIRLDADVLGERAAQRIGEWQVLSAEVARLEAEAEAAEEVTLPDALASDRPDLVEAQNRLLQARRRAVESRRASADQVVGQREGEVLALTQKKKRLRDTLKILREQESSIAALVEKGYYPRLKFLEIKREISEHEGLVAEVAEELATARSALEEARSQRLGVDRDNQAEILDQLELRRRERDVLYGELQQNTARMRSLEIRSPVAGVVQNLAVTSAGQAVRAGEPIMNIVPSNENLIIEARVENQDIGHVGLGQEAVIKVGTYDFIRYGTLAGEVEAIAADATEDPETGALTFAVLVRAERTYLEDGRVRLPVQPGMSVIVDLHIGERSILSYLTDRVLRTTGEAFQER